MVQAVRSFKRDRYGGPSGIRADDLKVWLSEATRDTGPVTYRWRLLVQLFQTTFKNEAVEEDVAWAKMIFLPKVRGEYREIGLVEVFWKVCVIVVNCRLKSSVTLYNAVHGFMTGRGTGTATLEEKLVQKLAGLAHELLFQVLLNGQKAYDSLDRGWRMEIL